MTHATTMDLYDTAKIPSVTEVHALNHGDAYDAKFVLVLVAIVSGAIAFVLSLIYGYIYFMKIRPRNRFLLPDNIHSYGGEVYAQWGSKSQLNLQDHICVRSHPFLGKGRPVRT